MEAGIPHKINTRQKSNAGNQLKIPRKSLTLIIICAILFYVGGKSENFQGVPIQRDDVEEVSIPRNVQNGFSLTQ